MLLDIADLVEDDNVNDIDVLDCFLEFACLPQNAMLVIIQKLYVSIYGCLPQHVCKWTTTDMLCWFRLHYTFDHDLMMWTWNGCLCEKKLN